MKQVLFLSGAGLSAESDIKTFRDHNGLWENYDVMEVCSVEGYCANPEKVHTFYDMRRADLANKHPNRAHFMMQRLQKQFPKQVSILTQNVDDLLERAGCIDVVHLHGTLRELRCTHCHTCFDIAYDPMKDHPNCPKCSSSAIRHNVVMFGESAPLYETLHHKLQDCTLLVVIGTSGSVLPIAQYAQSVPRAILNNLQPGPEIPEHNFSDVFYESAVNAAPKIEKIVQDFIKLP